jgi:flagellar biosynthetic protein FliR
MLVDLVPLILLVSIRVGIALAAMPAPFGDLAPVRIRAALGVLLSLAIAIPNVESLVVDVDLSILGLGRAALGEALVGVVIGLTVRVTLAAAQVAGSFAGFSMGLGFAQSVDPALGEMTTPVARLLASFAALIFLVLHGHHVVLHALVSTLHVAPPGDAFGAIGHEGVLSIGSEMLAHGLRIAAPVVATMFIVQLGTGLVSRAAPRVHIFALSFAVAAAAGMATLYIAAPSVANAVALEVRHLPAALEAAMGGR